MQLRPFLFLTVSMMTLPSYADNLDQAARDVCGCLAAPYAELEKALQSMKTEEGNDISQLMSSQGKLTTLFQETEKCTEALRKKYPEIDANNDLKKQVLDKTRQYCPNPLETVDFSAPN
ncbi:hypothetical protein [Photobacterium sp. 1_MG-2023]|uniref:hypothetical protein n=1 Tax=Photobacterium sp. 1_MG-2023 TaxID=3062646 RepID=UPI0026E11805|nr:hypothetical protein [Photobacterium sp. 1_MG-2023]MDO6705996.1 hypothetical protein [Photobacterium sp. 1_MG-2023]